MNKIVLVVLSLCILGAWAKPHSQSLDVTANPEECAICEALVSAVDSWLESNKTETEIETLLDQLCALVPKYETVCDKLIAAGVPTLINMVEQEYPPSVICGWFGFCAATTVEEKVTAPSECSACEELVNVIESWLASEKGITEIETLLDSLCSHIPKYETTCDAIVAAGVPTAIGWIEQYENATKVCTQLNACSADEEVDMEQLISVLKSTFSFNEESRKRLFKFAFNN